DRAVVGEEEEDVRVVGLLARRLLDERVGLGGVAARALELREDVDQVHLVGRRLGDALLQRLDRALLAIGGVEEVGQPGVGGDLLVLFRRLDRLGERRLGVVEAGVLVVAADEAGVGAPVVVARILGDDPLPGLLRLLEQAALAERVRERAPRRGIL